LQWIETAGVPAVNLADLADINPNTLWYRGKYVVAQSQDLCKVGAWVYARSPLSVSKTPLFVKLG